MKEKKVRLVDRPARALIGWMATNEALLTMSGRQTNGSTKPEHEDRARRAHACVQDRPPGLNQERVVLDAPPQLARHVEQLRDHPGSSPLFKEGWDVRVANLRGVIAMQPVVFVDNADERTAGIDPSDVASLASVSIPIPENAPLPAQFDHVRQAFMFSSANPNLRIVGTFQNPAGAGLAAVGFVVGVSTSLVQVARFRGRYFLRDGYHRAYSFLKRGIEAVPVMVREYKENEDLGMPAGMLPPGTYLGERPPHLADYLDDRVAADVRLPQTQKMVVIQGLELTPMTFALGADTK